MAASDFTNVRAEAYSFDQNVVRYTYGGSGNISLWRSTDGSSYSKVISIPSDYGSYPDLYDSPLASETLYYYKLSDNNGSTFTAVVTAKTHKQFAQKGAVPAIALPTFPDKDSVTAESLDNFRSQLEAYFNGEPGIDESRMCKACPVNGAIVLDCSDGCRVFVIDSADITDINSISVNCDELEVVFNVPADTPTEICGWPEDLGFDGDECYQAPISGGPTSVGGGGGPLVITRNPCQVVRYRYPLFPCVGENTKDCFDVGSLSWVSAWNFTMPECTPPGGTGCCSGNLTRRGIFASTYSGFVYSGKISKDKPLEPHPMAGYSLLFAGGTQGFGTPGPYEVELTLGVNSTKVIGKPIFGCALNVPPTATTENFTGLVLLLDYHTPQMLLGQYTNQNLRTEMPAVISSASLPSEIGYIFMSNLPSFPFGEFEVFKLDGSPTGTIFSNSGFVAPTSGILGSGFVWVGNPGIGNHMGYIGESSLSSYISVTPP